MIGQSIAGAAMGLLALLGLFCISRATDGMFAFFGTMLFVFGLAAIITLVHQATSYAAQDEELDALDDTQQAVAAE